MEIHSIPPILYYGFNKRFAIELRLISIVQLIITLCDTGQYIMFANKGTLDKIIMISQHTPLHWMFHWFSFTVYCHLGCVHAYFAKAESAFWNADSKRRSKTPFTGVLFMLPSRRRRFREHALRIVRGYCSSSSEPERRLYDVISWLYVILRSCFHQNQRFALTTIVNAHFWAFWISVLKRRLFENKHGRNSVLL